ncbi:cilia- and flagella-associated protein 251-like [Benincasa hispida]|uniref:cilia- and flagella-associated protein 251-like n=1 Tax=Benincasa hispida TaxID=102211 RepID=UPI001900C79E|nr:cilia- and flagella-associated protein 251-like [Benincasa hispida]
MNKEKAEGRSRASERLRAAGITGGKKQTSKEPIVLNNDDEAVKRLEPKKKWRKEVVEEREGQDEQHGGKDEQDSNEYEEEEEKLEGTCENVHDESKDNEEEQSQSRGETTQSEKRSSSGELDKKMETTKGKKVIIYGMDICELEICPLLATPHEMTMPYFAPFIEEEKRVLQEVEEEMSKYRPKERVIEKELDGIEKEQEEKEEENELVDGSNASTMVQRKDDDEDEEGNGNNDHGLKIQSVVHKETCHGDKNKEFEEKGSKETEVKVEMTDKLYNIDENNPTTRIILKHLNVTKQELIMMANQEEERRPKQWELKRKLPKVNDASPPMKAYG